MFCTVAQSVTGWVPSPKLISLWLPRRKPARTFVHCHARTSHNRRYPGRHPGKSLPGIVQLWLQHQVVSDTEGRPVSSEPSQPQPRARKSLCPMTLSCCGGFPVPQCQPTGGGRVCQIQVSAQAAGIIPDRPAREPSSSLTSTEEWPAAPSPLSSETYRQPLFSAGHPPDDEAIAAAAFRRGSTGNTAVVS